MWTAKRCHAAGLFLVVFVLVMDLTGQVQSQEKYPTRAIDIILPASAGGSLDLATRVLASHLNKKWKVPVNVVNKPGGNSIPGSLDLHKSAPDGYTMFADNVGYVIVGVFVKNLPYNPLDRTFIGTHSESPYLLAVPSTSPFKTLVDLISEIKKNPGSILYTAQGGGGTEFTMRQFFSAIGADPSKMRPVATQGGSQTAVMLSGGHVTVGSTTVGSLLPAIQGGLVKTFFVTSEKRVAKLPDVPTAKEVGYPAVNNSSWAAISGPPKLPSNIVNIWSSAIQEAVKDPQFISEIENTGSSVIYWNAQETKARAMRDISDANRLFAQ